ncbi:MAG: thrombospondin type 3 repeat-containing protein [Myxococcales bacterium]|nr:thrombospondin type 3 repeat-containing protein [Myxococcales bacterium]
MLRRSIPLVLALTAAAAAQPCADRAPCPIGAVCAGGVCVVDVAADRDRDGVPDGFGDAPRDVCVEVPDPGQDDRDRDGLGDACDASAPFALATPRDDDGDGVPDAVDNCALPNPAQTDTDGDGRGDACDPDDDGDGLVDAVDPCPTRAGATGCAPDRDVDGVPDPLDNCPDRPNPRQDDQDLDGRGDACDGDGDGDGVPDEADNCPRVANPGQADRDRDGAGDACAPDADHDGVPDDVDVCPGVVDPGQQDTDADGIGDACDPDDDGDGVADALDGCPSIYDPAQREADRIRAGDRCVAVRPAPPADRDGDGVPDAADDCPDVPDRAQVDTDGDGAGDACDPDADDDGVPNADDVCPGVVDPLQVDTDGDGRGDACDPDDDDDGMLDADDPCPLLGDDGADRDGDGLGDACDLCPDLPARDNLDADGDGLGNPCDPDADGDAVPDRLDRCPGTPDPAQFDRDCDGIGDACDTVFDPPPPEVCGDGVDDDCDGRADEGCGPCEPTFVGRAPVRYQTAEAEATRPEVAASADVAILGRLADDGVEQVARWTTFQRVNSRADSLSVVGRRPADPERSVAPPEIAWVGDRFWGVYASTDPVRPRVGGFTFGSTGQVTGGLPTLAATAPGPVEVAWDGGDTVAMAFFDEVAGARSLRWQVADTAGAVQAGPFEVPGVEVGPLDRPGVAVVDGLVGLTWTARAPGDATASLLFAAYDLEGGAVIPPTVVAADTDVAAPLAGGAARWLLAWPSGAAALGAGVGLDGALTDLGALIDAVGAPHVAWAGDAFVLVAPIEVEGAVEVGLLRVAADGTPEGPVHVLAPDPTTTARFPRVAWAIDGRYVVVWQADDAAGASTVWVIQGSIECE